MTRCRLQVISRHIDPLRLRVSILAHALLSEISILTTLCGEHST
ncbi:hypothetical protein [Marinobacter guineae]|nr:hypothetical protein [Marinobacter guineae]